MEKRRPSYDIDAIKRALGDVRTLTMTVQANLTALALGYDRYDICAVIRSITSPMFYKSMTTYADHRVWQDVYHVPSRGLVLYVKIQADLVTEFKLTSFKET